VSKCNPTSNSVLTALESRALRYQNSRTYKEFEDEQLLNEAIDETGTIPCAGKGGDEMSQVEVAEQHKKEIMGVLEYLLEVHGLPLGRKGDGVTRLVYENLNGLQSTMLRKNEKLEKARQVINDLQADIVCYNEHRQNFCHKSNWNGFWQMFNGSKTELRAIALHNRNKDTGKYQEGGTADSGRDDLGLGRWTYMKFSGCDNIVTRVIRGYSPCVNKKKDSGTVYQQHRWHLIDKLNNDTCLITRFREDLLHKMKQWQKKKEQLILCLNANTNIHRGQLGQQLTDLHGLGMKEVIGDFTAKTLGATYFQGSMPIDAIWATSKVTVANACVMPVGYGVGDYRLFVIDFATPLLVGTGCMHKIIRPALR
jgi:hypothetical protein